VWELLGYLVTWPTARENISQSFACPRLHKASPVLVYTKLRLSSRPAREVDPGGMAENVEVSAKSFDQREL